MYFKCILSKSTDPYHPLGMLLLNGNSALNGSHTSDVAYCVIYGEQQG